MATIEIPAAYVEDARQAIFAALVFSAETLQGDDECDRSCNAVLLNRDVGMLDQLLHAEGDIDITVEAPDPDSTSAPITEMLERMMQSTVERLSKECSYGPLPFDETVPLVDELGWIAREATRNHKEA